MAPTTRQASRPSAAQPRRKVSHSQGRQQDDSWELLDPAHQHNPPQLNGHSDEMDVDSSNIHADLTNPLREMAERVGREIEIFAEKLDSWKPKPHDTVEERQKAAIQLALEYKTVADDTVSRLQKTHGVQLRNLVKKEWRRSQAKDEAGTEAVDDDGAEDFDPRAKTTVKDLQQWQAESNTWALVYDLLQLQYSDLDPHDEGQKMAFSNDNDRFVADGTPWVEFLSSSDSAREKLVVMRWLENSIEQTGDDLDIIEEQLENISGKGNGLFGLGWVDTRVKLKGEKRLRLWDTPIDSGIPEIKGSEGISEGLVTQLDYDAAGRLGLTLEQADRSYETSFYVICWEMLRRGKTMDEIREWCTDRHEFARAVSLGAHPFEDTNQQLALSVATRFRWRQACGILSQLGGVSGYERAIYGVLCGDYDSSEKGCQSWNEHVWAMYTSSILIEYNAYVLEHYADQIPDHYRTEPRNSALPVSDNVVDWAQQVVASLQLKKDSHLDGTQPFKLIQASILSHDVPYFAMSQGVSLSRHTKQQGADSHLALIVQSATQLIPDDEAITSITDDANALRVLSHLILLFKDLGVDLGSEDALLAVENVLCRYIDFLRLSGKFSLIPLYASMISQKRSTAAIAGVLSDIVDPDERVEILQLMESAGLDVISVLKTKYKSAVAFSHPKHKDDAKFSGLKLTEPARDEIWPGFRISIYQDGEVSHDEQILIQSLEWFMLIDGYWAMPFEALTNVATRFLDAGRLDAAIELFHRLPFSEVSKALTSSQLGKAVDIMDDPNGSDDENTRTLRRSVRTRSMFRAPRGSHTTTVSKNRLLHDSLRHHAKTYHELNQLVRALEDLWNWRATEDEQLITNSAETKENCRLFLDDLIAGMKPLMHDFLQHPGPADTADQLRRLRHLYLPEMLMGYISALHFAGHVLTRDHLISIMDIATEIAGNGSLVECFSTTKRMPALVDAFAISSKTMLRLNEETTKNGKKRRSKSGKNLLGMWEIAA